MTQPQRIPRVLSIAGSDSSGGAGIQADLKAFAACRAHGMTALTAITAQSTLGVDAVHHVPPEMILAQVHAVLGDIGVDAVKIGMLGREATVIAVASALDELPAGTPIVLDPVMVSESGAELLDAAARAALITQLLPRADVITPNVPEARSLLAAAGVHAGGGEAEDSAREIGRESLQLRRLAEALQPLCGGALLITGGHREHATDLFVDGRQIVELPGERFPGQAAHGSGCTHSSVLAARLAWGDEPLQAARHAKRLAAAAVRDGLEQIGGGAGPVHVLASTL